MPPPHLMMPANLSAPQICTILSHAHQLKRFSTPWLQPASAGPQAPRNKGRNLRLPSPSLFTKTVSLMFSKRSIQTRVAAETSGVLLGGRALFLGREGIQLSVNESPRDTAHVIGGMCQGIFARVGDHSEIEELAKHSPVPVINTLSSFWHPTQVLADLLTLHENAHLFPKVEEPAAAAEVAPEEGKKKKNKLPELPPLTIAYVDDSASVLHDMLEVWDKVKELGCDKGIWWGVDPKEAVKGADVVITDTWISMGQEAEYAERVAAFQGYQVTEALCAEGGAKPHWKFLHCLPRKAHEVDDEVFYGPRSLTIMALFDLVIGKWTFDRPSLAHQAVVAPVEGSAEVASPGTETTSQ
ncbi:ornithine carbamoyltransferase 1 [Mycena floridula]|nr:ornithine carbamoyltransferase 1 [Mycena floridula]